MHNHKEHTMQNYETTAGQGDQPPKPEKTTPRKGGGKRR